MAINLIIFINFVFIGPRLIYLQLFIENEFTLKLMNYLFENILIESDFVILVLKFYLVIHSRPYHKTSQLDNMKQNNC